MLVLPEPNRANRNDSHSDDSPTKNRPTEPGATRNASRCGKIRSVAGWQSERNNLAAVAAAGKMPEHVVPLAAGQRVLRESGQQIGIGMRF